MPLGEDLRRRLREVLACPTAPFHEGRVHAVLREAVRAAPGRVRDRVDDHGNLEVVFGPGRPRLLFHCHTDHPALEARGDGTAAILGGMDPRRLRGGRLRLFDGSVAATVTGVVDQKKRIVRLRGGARLARGTPLLLDLPAFRITKRHVKARAIDDLCAVAACLTMLDRLAAARWSGTVGVLFTRAEEVGFAGALAWTRTTRYPRSTTIVNLEMSSARPHTPQGRGPILRVGDRITTFRQGLAVELAETAAALARRDEHFRYQRALMDGGACEATVFTFAGFRSGALCLPLKNYHNQAPGGGVGLEYVSTDDAENLVRWMVAFARECGRRDPKTRTLKRLDQLWRKNRRRLERSAGQGEGI